MENESSYTEKTTHNSKIVELAELNKEKRNISKKAEHCKTRKITKFYIQP
jgi:hypothetical protein